MIRINSLKHFYAVVAQAIKHEGNLFRLLWKISNVSLQEGSKGILFRIKHLSTINLQNQLLSSMQAVETKSINYETWLLRHEVSKLSPTKEIIASFKYTPLISIICPSYEPNTSDFEAAIRSVLKQSYANWELCIADDGSENFKLETFLKKFKDKRIKSVVRSTNGNISKASNDAITLSSGDFICFLDHDDELHPDALFWIASSINENPNLKFIYSDEDKLDADGQRCDPNFKPDFNYHYLLNCNYICHLAVYQKNLLEQLEGCRVGYEGAQDYDLILRAIEKVRPNEIAHIPRVLYHWRKHPDSTSENALAKPYAIEAGKRALESHLQRVGTKAKVEADFTRYKVCFENTLPIAKTTIIIPTKNQGLLLKTCIDSINSFTDNNHYQILIIDNQSDEQASLNYLKEINTQKNINVIKDPRAFNYSRMMNTAVSTCKTEYVCFLNNDIEVISKGWLAEMMSVITQEHVGIVGAKLLYPDNSIQHGGVILGIGSVAGHAHKYFPDGHPGYINRLEARQELSAVTGACLLTKKSTFEAVSGMDEENLSIAFNDVDFCLKVGELGLKIVWTPYAKLYHHESKSRGLEDTIAKQKRYFNEIETMKQRWGKLLLNDPAYNPNLTLTYENFTLAPKSRNSTLAESTLQDNTKQSM